MSLKRRITTGFATAAVTGLLLTGLVAPAEAYTKSGAGYACATGSLATIVARTEGNSAAGQNRRAYKTDGTVKIYQIPLSASGATTATPTSWRTLTSVSAYGNVAAYFAAQDCYS